MTVVGAPAPFRVKFDEARDPYAARNALGIAAGITSATPPLSITGGVISITPLTGDVTTSGAVATIAADAVTNAKLADMAAATVKGRASGAGTGNPTDLIATEVGAIIAPAWTAYTPTVTPNSGTFTSVSATGKYLTLGKLTFVRIHVVITTNGTAAGAVNATLPNTASATTILIGRETGLTGKLLQGITAGTFISIVGYDNIYPGGSGAQCLVTGSYENT